MAESQEAGSLRLYEILERVGLSEEMRLCHRQAVVAEKIRTVWLNLRTGDNDETYCFGSFSEGSTVRGMKSDIDNVHCYTNPPVVTDVRESGVRLVRLMVQDKNTYPGYVKLQGVLYGIPLTKFHMNEDGRYGPDVDGRMCLKYHREQGSEVHGPAMAESDERITPIPIEIVPAEKCLSVPDIVTQWLLRKRRYGWPQRRCMEAMAALPYFLVGVGHPYSIDRDLNWRISYSLHERELMFSLNPTQHKCYGNMKMIKNDVIEPAVGEKSISSYHLKSCLFWAIEKIPASIWRPDQLLHCICLCFWYLLFFISTQNCPNYFRPDANLFEREVFVRLQYCLSAEVKRIIQTLPDVVCQIKCADVGRHFKYRTLNISRQVLDGIQNQRTLCSRTVNNSLERLMQGLLQISHKHVSQQERVKKWYNLLHKLSCERRIIEYMEEEAGKARQLMLACLHFRLATCLAAEGFNSNNGPMGQNLLQLSILHLTQCSTRDLMGSRLMYVTILYKLERYSQCEVILRQIDRDLHPYATSDCRCSLKELKFNHELTKWEAANKPSARSLLVSAIVRGVTFLPSERGLAPEPLPYELDRSTKYPNRQSVDDYGNNLYDWACVDGKVYFHLMQYLVYSKLCLREEKDKSRKSLSDVIKNDPNLCHNDTAYNVLGWIYVQENMLADAFRCWKLSLEIQDLKPRSFDMTPC